MTSRGHPLQHLNLSTLKPRPCDLPPLLLLHGHRADCGIAITAPPPKSPSPRWTTPACFPTPPTVMVTNRVLRIGAPASHPPPFPVPGSSRPCCACWDRVMPPHSCRSFACRPDPPTPLPSRHTGQENHTCTNPINSSLPACKAAKCCWSHSPGRAGVQQQRVRNHQL